MSRYNYPEPKAPRYKKPTSIDDCLPQARMLVKKQQGRGAMGFVTKGDNILIVTVADQDEYVQAAMTQAFKEAGAEKVTFVAEHVLSGKEPEASSVEDGWREANTVEIEPWKMSGSQWYTDISDAIRDFLTKNPDYTSVVYGLGGSANLRYVLKEHGSKYKRSWMFNSWEEFVSRAWPYPDELWHAIEMKVIEALGKASAVKITDPEGTHLEYPLSPEDAKRWEMSAFRAGHLFLDPLHATSEEIGVFSPENPPVFRDVNGVLAGTSNHMGFIPRIELHFEHGRLIDVRGGGKYGEMIGEMMDKYKEVQWPGYPGKGFFWYCDCALCTVVKAFRRTSDMFKCYWRLPNLSERNRAGVFHQGIGSRRHGKAYVEYAAKRNLPMGHIHVHNYFATFEIKLQGTNHWYRIVDKGWLTGMGDPDIWALAAKYGTPEDLLSHDWVPPLPGINCEGDYFQDYAPGPVPYLKKRLADGKPI